jgi:hypothetical protein
MNIQVMSLAKPANLQWLVIVFVMSLNDWIAAHFTGFLRCLASLDINVEIRTSVQAFSGFWRKTRVATSFSARFSSRLGVAWQAIAAGLSSRLAAFTKRRTSFDIWPIAHGVNVAQMRVVEQ